MLWRSQYSERVGCLVIGEKSGVATERDGGAVGIGQEAAFLVGEGAALYHWHYREQVHKLRFAS